MSIAGKTPGARCLLIMLLLTTCGFGRIAISQQQTATVTGTVRNSSGEALSAARVALLHPQNDTELMTGVSAADGSFVFQSVPHGTYVVNVAKSGYTPATAGSFILTGENNRVSFTLTLKPLQVVRGNAGSGANGSTGKAPSFRPSGIQGTTAPSGYSSGAAAEQSSRAMDLIVGLPTGVSAAFALSGERPGCEAESSLLAAVHDDPAGYKANHKLGVFFLWHAEPARSIQYLSAASLAEPANTDNSRDLAYAYLGTKQYVEAIALLQHVIGENARVANLHTVLADVYAAAGQKSMAVAEYERAAVLDPGEQNMVEIGFDLLRLGCVDEAAQLFTSGANSHASSARLWLGRGIAEDLQQERLAAIESLLRAASLDPNLEPAYSFLANLCGFSSEVDIRITSAISKFVAAHPADAVAHYDLALALWRQPRGAAAELDPRIKAELKLAIAKDPRLSNAHFQLGVLYFDVRDYQESVVELRRAIELRPGKPDWHYHLFQAYRGDKQLERADEELKVFEEMRQKEQTGNDEASESVNDLSAPLFASVAAGERCDAANVKGDVKPSGMAK